MISTHDELRWSLPKKHKTRFLPKKRQLFQAISNLYAGVNLCKFRTSIRDQD